MRKICNFLIFYTTNQERDEVIVNEEVDKLHVGRGNNSAPYSM